MWVKVLMKGEFESAVSKPEKEWKYNYFSSIAGYYYNKVQTLLYVYCVQAWQLKNWQLCVFWRRQLSKKPSLLQMRDWQLASLVY